MMVEMVRLVTLGLGLSALAVCILRGVHAAGKGGIRNVPASIQIKDRKRITGKSEVIHIHFNGQDILIGTTVGRMLLLAVQDKKDPGCACLPDDEER